MRLCQWATRRRPITALGMAVVGLMGAVPATPAVTYHRGPLMPAVRAHLIVWLPRGRHFESNDRRYVTLTQRFLRALDRTRYFDIVREYASAPGFGAVVEGPVTSRVSLIGTYVDRRAYPGSATDARPLTMRTLRNEIVRVIRVRRWTASLRDLYIVLTAAGMRTCVEFAGACSRLGAGRPLLACTTHQYFVPEDQPVLFLYLPVVYGQAGCLPDARRVMRRGSDPVATAELDALARGLWDSVTDPLGTGWYAGTPTREIGDLCPGLRSVRLGRETFRLPLIWARVQRRCTTSAR